MHAARTDEEGEQIYRVASSAMKNEVCVKAGFRCNEVGGAEGVWSRQQEADDPCVGTVIRD